MKEVQLRPITGDASDWEKIKREILRVLKENFYLPLMREVTNEVDFPILNSQENLLRSIQLGRVRFDRGRFKGTFGHAVAKELRALGARWDSKSKSFKLPLGQLPPHVRTAIDASAANFAKVLKSIDQRLNDVRPEDIAEKIRTDKLFDTTLLKLDSKFKDSIKAITVAPEMTKEHRARMAAEYTGDLKRDIKNFVGEQTVQLRKQIQDRGLKGFRAESVVQEIRKSYNVSINKAQFLARQETSLMTAKFREIRFQDAGSKEYIWRNVNMPKDKTPQHHDPGNVRYSHGLLDGKKFSWTNPPVTSIDGRRNHPGQDFRCRCIAIPVVKFG